jgi:hypothetical protein
MEYICKLSAQESALHNAIAELWDKADAAEESGDIGLAAAHEAAAAALSELHHDVQEKIESWQSESARRAADCRLAYHVENDTLDLY